MPHDQSAEELMLALQKGIDSGDAHGWISKEEATKILAVDEDEAERKIFAAAMASYQKDPLTYSLEEACALLDLGKVN